jgi:hypothetical protein
LRKVAVKAQRDLATLRPPVMIVKAAKTKLLRPSVMIFRRE